MQVYRLGKHPKKNDSRNLKLCAYFKTEALPALPDSYDWTSKVTVPFGMMLNDSVGDCTCASAGHMQMSFTADNGDLVVPTDAQIIAAYSAITGYNPSNPATDQGANELDVLKFWKNNGIAGNQIGAFAEVDITNLNDIKYSVYLFGGCYIGVQLPISYQGASSWFDPPDLEGNNAPGSWGGHAVPILGWDETGVTVITWGAPMKMTWKSFSAYCEEAYAILSNQFVTGAKTSPDGFDLSALQADLNAL